MLYQQQGHEQSRSAAGLIALARAALRYDPDVVRDCLQQLSELPGLQSSSTTLESDAAQSAVRAPLRGGLAVWQIKRIIAYVDVNLEGAISIADLAAETQLSSSHLCRAFKVSMGETPHAYVMRRRIAQAQYLLLVTGDTLSEIAYACGLTDQAHLTRLFRRFAGTTPLVWRRTWRRAA